jgi:hypothetical protein
MTFEDQAQVALVGKQEAVSYSVSFQALGKRCRDRCDKAEQASGRIDEQVEPVE